VMRRAQNLLEERADEIVVGSLGEDSPTRAALRSGLRRRLSADPGDGVGPGNRFSQGGPWR
jgi:hypothetical protein